MYHLIDAVDMSRPEWDELYNLCSEIIDHPKDFTDACHGRLMGSLFYEPSTRTNLSFSSAMLRLGGSVVGFSDPGSSSVAKGETLKDTIIMVSGYTDVIAMRNPKEGAAKAASLYSAVPVINAGDGGHLHPTQTLTDLTTIRRIRGSFSSISIGLCGDLKHGRTVHSLIRALCHLATGIQFYLISPRELAVPDYIRDVMVKTGQKFYEISNLESVIPMLDVLYMTRVQRERFIDPLEYERLKHVYVLDAGKLSNAKKELIILHPLPRVDEIAQSVDPDPRAAYFKQARLGMYIRMALLLTLSGKERREPMLFVPEKKAPACMNEKCVTRTEGYLPEDVTETGGQPCCGYCEKPLNHR